MGNHCRDLKQHDPINFPSDRKIEYWPKMSTTMLHGHIERFHLLEFLELAQKENWKVFTNKIKLALELGYNVSTLLKALKQLGVTWSNLPPPHPDLLTAVNRICNRVESLGTMGFPHFQSQHFTDSWSNSSLLMIKYMFLKSYAVCSIVSHTLLSVHQRYRVS